MMITRVRVGLGLVGYYFRSGSSELLHEQLLLNLGIDEGGRIWIVHWLLRVAAARSLI